MDSKERKVELTEEETAELISEFADVFGVGKTERIEELFNRIFRKDNAVSKAELEAMKK